MPEKHVTLSDHLLYAAAVQAKTDERHNGNSDGVASLIRKALKYWLSKNGWSARFLDGNGSIPHDGAKVTAQTFPGTRNNTEEDGPQDKGRAHAD